MDCPWPGVVAEVEAEAVGEGEFESLLIPLFGVSIVYRRSAAKQGGYGMFQVRSIVRYWVFSVLTVVFLLKPATKSIKGVSPYVKVNNGSCRVQLAPVLDR